MHTHGWRVTAVAAQVWSLWMWVEGQSSVPPDVLSIWL